METQPLNVMVFTDAGHGGSCIVFTSKFEVHGFYMYDWPFASSLGVYTWNDKGSSWAGFQGKNMRNGSEMDGLTY